MFDSSSGFVRAIGYGVAIAALCIAVAGLAACGDGSTSVETGGSGQAISEPMTSLAGGVTSSALPGASEGADDIDVALVGKWHSDQTGETFEFTADGRLVVTSGNGAVTDMNYTADGSNISYLIDGVVVYTGTYSVDGDVLSQVDPQMAGTVYFDRVE